jgi:hypothetical protein
MRLVVIILAFAAAPVAAAILWMRAQPEPLPVNSLQPRGIVWADRVFTDPAEFRRWLRARGERYKVWAHHHPLQAATLERRRLPSTLRAREPRVASGGEPRGLDNGILALIAGIAGLGVLTLHLRRQVRFGRPRVRLSAVAVDVAPLANGVRRNLDRLSRVPNVIRAGRMRTRAARPHLEPPRPFAHSRGNGSTPRPVQSRPVIGVSRAAEPRVVSDAVVERVVPTVEPATALADLTLVEEPPDVEEPRQVEELREAEEPRRPAASQNGTHVEVEPEVSPVEPTRQNGSRADVELEVPPVEPPRPAASRNGSHVEVEPEVSLVEPAPQNGSHLDVQKEVPPVEPPKPRNTDALRKDGWERCAVSCWRGYVTAQFYAHPAGEAEAIATSSPFEWRAWQQAPKNAQAAQEALDELRELLEVAGWETAGRGDAWYELRFQREPPIGW